jgi:hypothetical protein
MDITFEGEKSGIYSNIAIGDSIIKNRNTMATKITSEYGVKGIYNVDFGCDTIK